MKNLGQEILVVEDDQEIAEAIIEELRGRSYRVAHAATGSQGLDSIRNASFDLLIVDRMLPEIDGLSIIESLRKENRSVPILIISALDDVSERILGLEKGADDYLPKPFSFAEMGARVEALLRRPTQARTTTLQAGSLMLDLLQRTVSINGEKVALSSREFQLLEYFVMRQGQLITRDMLIENVWKYRFAPETNVIDVHISNLRRKIDSNRVTSLIQTIRGCGFVFNADI
jgi:two-component system, OmpR family, response regulator